MQTFLHRCLFNYFTLYFSIFSLALFATTYFILSHLSTNELLDLDIRAFYTSGLMIRNEITGNMYDVLTQYHWQKTIVHTFPLKDLLVFLNPPFVALVFSPLTFLSFRNAYIAFAYVNTILMLISVYFIVRNTYQSLYGNRLLPILLFSFFYLPNLATIYEGQLSFFLLLSVVLSWWFFKRGNPFLSGMSLALLLIKPHLLCLPILLLFWKKQWSALFGLSSATCVLLLISWIVVGTKGLIRYFYLLFSAPFLGDQFTIHPQREATLRGFLQLIFHTDNLYTIIVPLLLLFCLIVFIFLYVWRGTWESKTTTFDLQWAIMIIIMILTSIHTNYPDLTMLLFPCIIFLKDIPNNILLYSSLGIITGIFIIFCSLPSLLTPIIVIILGILIYRYFRISNLKQTDSEMHQ